MKIRDFSKNIRFLLQISFLTSFRAGVANQPETKNLIFYCVTAKSLIFRVAQKKLVFSKLTHLPRKLLGL